NKKKKNISHPFEAFNKQTDEMMLDMKALQNKGISGNATIHQDDARVCSKVSDDSISLVITSPPYINNFDYADATRLEMTFWGEVNDWGDLQEKVRRHLIRSCAQHMSYDKESLDQLLSGSDLLPIIQELRLQCESLAVERLNHGGKKNYHLMTAA